MGTKISELPAGSSAGSTDQLPANQGGTTRRLTVAQIIALITRPILVPLAYDNPVAVITWTSMPAALTEFNSQTRTRTKVDLALFTEARMVGNVIAAGVAGAELRVQYSTDQSSWAYLDGSAGPALLLTNGSVLVVGGWVTLAAPAKADVFLRLVGIGGNGATSPTFTNVGVQFR